MLKIYSGAEIHWCVFTRSSSHFFFHPGELWSHHYAHSPYAHKHSSGLVKAPDGSKSYFMSRTWWKCFPGHRFFALWQAVGLFLHTPAPWCAISIILLWQGPDTRNRPCQMYMNYSDLAKNRCTAWCKFWDFSNLILSLLNWKDITTCIDVGVVANSVIPFF